MVRRKELWKEIEKGKKGVNEIEKEYNNEFQRKEECEEVWDGSKVWGNLRGKKGKEHWE